MKSRKKRSKSVLYGQNRTEFFVNHRMFLAWLGLILLGLALFYQSQKSLFIFIQSRAALFSASYRLTPIQNPSVVTIQYPLDSYHSRQLATVAEILESMFKIYDKAFIEKALKISYNYGYIDTIYSKKVGLNQYAVAISPKLPVLCAQMDTLRLVTAKGQLYGSAQDRTKCPFGVINGIFGTEELGRIQLNPDRTVVIRPEHSAILLEAIELIKALKISNLHIKADFHFDKSRGFTFHLANPMVEVILGRSPFLTNISRLNKILLTKRQSNIEKIELDYREKAFIKYAKPST